MTDVPNPGRRDPAYYDSIYHQKKAASHHGKANFHPAHAKHPGHAQHHARPKVAHVSPMQPTQAAPAPATAQQPPKKRRTLLYLSEAVIIILIFIGIFLVVHNALLDEPKAPDTPREDVEGVGEAVSLSIVFTEEAKAKMDTYQKETVTSLLKQGFTVAVPVKEFVAAPGETVFVGFGITNWLGKIRNFEVRVRGISARMTSRTRMKLITSSWYSGNVDVLHLVPKESEVMGLKLDIPEDAGPGEYIFDIQVCYDDYVDQMPDAGCSKQYNKHYGQTQRIKINVVE